MSIEPAEGSFRSSGTVTFPQLAPGGHAASAVAAVLGESPKARSAKAEASAPAARAIRWWAIKECVVEPSSPPSACPRNWSKRWSLDRRLRNELNRRTGPRSSCLQRGRLFAPLSVEFGAGPVTRPYRAERRLIGDSLDAHVSAVVVCVRCLTTHA